MLKKELAKLLGISPAMVSKLAKMGMPTDTVEKAIRWRRLRLDPGRIKGVRFDPNKKPEPPFAPRAGDDMAAVASGGAPIVRGRNLTVMAEAVNRALIAGAVGPCHPLILSLRMGLRSLSYLEHAQQPVAMPIRVWLALIGYVFTESALDRLRDAVPDETVTAGWVAREMHLTQHPSPAEWVIEAARDAHGLDGLATNEEQAE